MKKGQFTQLFAILLLFLIIVGVLVFVLPMRDNIAELQAEKDSVSTELEGLQSEYDSLFALSEEVAKSEATKQALIDAVPEGEAQDELILEIEEMAEKADFELNAINFSKSIDQTYGNAITVTANFSGSYDDLIAFLQKIETADRLMQVTSLSVQLTSTTEIVFNLNIEAYYQ